VESLRAGVVRLEAADVQDAATQRAVDTAGADVEPPPAPALGPPPEVVERTEAFRSGDAGRVRAALAGDLDPLLVAAALPLLARDDLFADVLSALRRTGGRCTGQFVDVLLDPGADPRVRRRVCRVLAAIPTQRAADGLLAALADERFDVRYRSAQALLRQRLRSPQLVLSRGPVLAAARREAVDDTVWAGGDPHRTLEHVIAILSLVVEGEPLRIALRAMRGDDPALRGTALEYLDLVLPPEVREALWPRLGAVRPAPSGRSPAEMRDELLRSSSQWTVATRRPRSGVVKA
jgi:hypothetical protein